MIHRLASSRITRRLVLLGVLAVSCPAARLEAQDTAEQRFTQEDFTVLRWLEGSWRGTGGRNPFFERYRFANDTTIQILYYVDSTLTRVRALGNVQYANGAIYHRADGAVWIAQHVDSTSIHFVPHENASNGFTWARESPSAWVATLRFQNGREAVYRMERLTP